MKYKVLVITGTRSEYGILKTVIGKIAQSKILELKLLVTGMHTLSRYGNSINEIKKDKTPIANIVKISPVDDMLTALTKEIMGIKKFCLKEKPSLILVLGDRDEALAGAIVGGHLGIPVGHIHGGDISGGYTVDADIRNAITKFSHLHFTASKKSFDRVKKQGEEKWRVFNTGAPGLDDIKTIVFLNKQEIALKLGLNEKNKWIVVVQHPTPFDKVEVTAQLLPTIRALSEVDAEKIIIYPNNDTGSRLFINEITKTRNKHNMHIYKNIERGVYLSLLKNSDVLVGNSSSGIIEAGYFRLPVVDIGNRQLGRECGKNVVHVDYDRNQIQKAIKKALITKYRSLVNPYGNGSAGKKIVEIIEKNIANPDLLYKKFE